MFHLQYPCQSQRQKRWILSMFSYRTTHESGHHCARWVVQHIESHLHYFHMWLYLLPTRTLPWHWSLLHLWSLDSVLIYKTVSAHVRCWYHYFLPNYRSVIPSCGPRNGGAIISNPLAVQFEHCALYTCPRFDASVLECNKWGQRTKGKQAMVELVTVCLLKLNSWRNQLVYLVSLSLFTLGTIIVALSHSIELWVEWHPIWLIYKFPRVIGFRCIQGAG